MEEENGEERAKGEHGEDKDDGTQKETSSAPEMRKVSMWMLWQRDWAKLSFV